MGKCGGKETAKRLLRNTKHRTMFWLRAETVVATRQCWILGVF